MPRIILTIGLLLLATAAGFADEKPKPGHAKRDGLSLTVSLDKKTFAPDDDITLHFVLKNESDKPVYIGDGYLAPGYHESGPGRHFEVHVKVSGDATYF